MQDYLSIGSVPHECDCAQVGRPDYDTRSRIECNVFLKQIKRVCGEPPAGARLVVKSFPHDFGSYREVCVVFDDENREATDYALKCEGADIPKWDNEAIDELVKLIHQ